MIVRTVKTVEFFFEILKNKNFFSKFFSKNFFRNSLKKKKVKGRFSNQTLFVGLAVTLSDLLNKTFSINLVSK